jgi:hypothetical protein
MKYIPIQPNLESKTRPKQLLGSLPLDIALPGLHFSIKILDLSANMEVTATNTLAYCCTASIAAVKDEEKKTVLWHWLKVKKYKKAVTLAIGDGANDVSMIKSKLVLRELDEWQKTKMTKC